MFRLNRDKLRGSWRKLLNGELPNLYSSPSKIKMIKSKRMRQGENVAPMARNGVTVVYWWESKKERDHYEE
jgi:hypothetical protein